MTPAVLKGEHDDDCKTRDANDGCDDGDERHDPREHREPAETGAGEAGNGEGHDAFGVDGTHDLVSRQSQQVADRDELIIPLAKPIDDLRKRPNRACSAAARVVQQYDDAFVLVP